jgi:hypothetical protein
MILKVFLSFSQGGDESPERFEIATMSGELSLALPYRIEDRPSYLGRKSFPLKEAGQPPPADIRCD